MTGTASRIMARGSLMRRPCSSRRLKAVTILRRLIVFWRRCAESGRRPSLASIMSRSFDLLGVEVDAVDELEDVLGAHAALEVLVVAEPQLAPEHLVLDDLAAVQAAELVEGALGDLDLLLGPLADRLDLLLDGALAGLDLGLAGPLALELLELVLEGLEAAVDVQVALLLDVGDLFGHLVLEEGRSWWRFSSSTQVTRLAAK